MTPRLQPLFWTVTGRDFGRSIAWAKKQPNVLREHVRAELARRKKAALIKANLNTPTFEKQAS